MLAKIAYLHVDTYESEFKFVDWDVDINVSVAIM